MILNNKLKLNDYFCSIQSLFQLKYLFMKKGFLQLLTVFALVLLTSASVLAQGTVTGKLVDADNGEPLISASVVIEGTSIGTLSDYDGNFSIKDAPSGAQTGGGRDGQAGARVADKPSRPRNRCGTCTGARTQA